MSASVEIEYEKTYLARTRPPGLNLASSEKLIDVYFPDDPAVHPRLRIRQKGDRFELTKKLPISENDASAHSETTIELTQQEFDELTAQSKRRVEKTRFYLPIEGRDAEIDVFEGKLKGLVLLDFEFSNANEMKDFLKPEVCLADVTQEEFIAGGLLAGKSYEDIEEELRKFDYERV